MSTKAEYQQRLDNLLSHADTKVTLIKDLLQYAESLTTALESSEKSLIREKDVANMYDRDFRESEGKLRKLTQNTQLVKFVAVLIDGDGMPVRDNEAARVLTWLTLELPKFLDSLVKKGADGGREAVHLLKTAVTAHIDSLPTEPPTNLRILIKVFVNMTGLTKTYKDSKIVSDETDMKDFIRTFNSVDPHCEFIDAGNGKEAADRKVEANFLLHVDNLHCHHLILGASADNNYARLLEQYRMAEKYAGRITLLRGPPLARELLALQNSFESLSASNVFRANKIVTRRVSFSQTTPPTTPTPDYASMAALPSTAQGPISISVASGTSRAQSAPNRVARNRSGQRVDVPLQVSMLQMNKIKREKYCNNFHIVGFCPFTDCSHKHGSRLDGQALEALRAVARLSPCPAELSCDDKDCCMGHRCMRHVCNLGSDCWFSPAMHNVDTNIVEMITV